MNSLMKSGYVILSLLAAPALAQTAGLGDSVRNNMAVSAVAPPPTEVIVGEGTSANIKRQIAAQRRYTSSTVYDLMQPIQPVFFPGKRSAGTEPAK